MNCPACSHQLKCTKPMQEYTCVECGEVFRNPEDFHEAYSESVGGSE